MNYSIDLLDFNIIKEIKRNIKVFNINIIIFIIFNKNKLIFYNILYILKLFYSLLSLNQLIIIDNIILFNDLYYIIENNIEFHIKFKFELFFDIINIFFHFHVDFSIIESNFVNFKFIEFNFIDFEFIEFNLANFKSIITKNQITL